MERQRHYWVWNHKYTDATKKDIDELIEFALNKNCVFAQYEYQWKSKKQG